MKAEKNRRKSTNQQTAKVEQNDVANRIIGFPYDLPVPRPAKQSRPAAAKGNVIGAKTGATQDHLRTEKQGKDNQVRRPESLAYEKQRLPRFSSEHAGPSAEAFMVPSLWHKIDDKPQKKLQYSSLKGKKARASMERVDSQTPNVIGQRKSTEQFSHVDQVTS